MVHGEGLIVGNWERGLSKVKVVVAFLHVKGEPASGKKSGFLGGLFLEKVGIFFREKKLTGPTSGRLWQ